MNIMNMSMNMSTPVMLCKYSTMSVGHVTDKSVLGQKYIPSNVLPIPPTAGFRPDKGNEERIAVASVATSQ